MDGFFSKKETQSVTRPDGKVYSCYSCKRYKNANSPKLKPFGNFSKKILCVGEAPGKTEDRTGKCWQGQSGKLLQRTLQSFGIDLFEDCLSINAVNCYTESPPTNYEIDCCSKHVQIIIKKYKPKLIIVFGSAALYSIIGKFWSKKLGTIQKWNGCIIPEQNYQCWICPVFHPSFVLRNEREITTIWKQDLRKAVETINTPFLKHEEPKIKLITDLSVLDEIQSKVIAIDYETTGLKPHAKGHRIICASVAISENECFTFMMSKTRAEIQPFLNLLQNKNIKKIAHNVKYEDTWSNVRLHQQVINWHWDTMLTAHILDNQPGICGLKFQTYINFGISDYDSEISSYLKGDEKDSNSKNNIEKLITNVSNGKNLLLKYCGLDTIYTYRLYIKQRKEIYDTKL